MEVLLLSALLTSEGIDISTLLLIFVGFLPCQENHCIQVQRGFWFHPLRTFSITVHRIFLFKFPFYLKNYRNQKDK